MMTKTNAFIGRAQRRAGRLRRLLRRFASATGGAAAAEIALVLAPFLLMLVGIMEIGMVLFVSMHLEDAVHDAARQIRTGTIQTGDDPIGGFRTLLCDELVVAIACDDRLVVDVRPFNSFNLVNPEPYYDADGEAQGNLFTPGDAGDIVLVRVAYNWHIMTPLLGRLLSDDGGGRKLIVSAAAFRNEPYRGALP